MEVSIMIDICTNCIFTLYGRIPYHEELWAIFTEQQEINKDEGTLHMQCGKLCCFHLKKKSIL